MAVLATESLVKIYRQRKVVDGVSLHIASGEVVGLLGPNGAGKTTSFYMIVGLIAVDQGRVLINQRDMTDLPMHARARLGVGYLPQEASVFRKLTVEQNLLAILQTRSELGRKEQRRLTTELLDELGIEPLRKNTAMSLSGGERRRLEIARCLAAEPRFVLLDEPFAGVDPLAVLDIKSIIGHLCQRNIGVLITDHNVRETLDICHRAYIIHRGQVMAEGEPKAILNNKEVRTVYLGENFTL